MDAFFDPNVKTTMQIPQPMPAADVNFLDLSLLIKNSDGNVFSAKRAC